MIIGICGKSGSGKSSLAKKIVKHYGDRAIHLDIDKVGHHVLTIPEVLQELSFYFGDTILKDGSVNRKKLGEFVFQSREKMSKLTDITWKYMQMEIDRFLKENSNKVIILDWILLPSSKYFSMCDVKILLDIPYEVRCERAMMRDSICEEDFSLREQASISFHASDFTYILKNNDPENIQRLVMKL